MHSYLRIKRRWRWAVVLSVIANWIFLEMNVINLASNYSAVYEGWSAGKAVYSILVVQNGVGNAAMKAIMLTLLTIAIFFATISTAINYAQGFNDRVLNWYQKRINEAPGSIRRETQQARNGSDAGLYLPDLGRVPGGTYGPGIQGA